MRRVFDFAAALMLTIASVWAAEVPLVLPRPDGNPGNMSKPVKVYILAGQSNMFGFGALAGSRPAYRSIMFSADPNLIPGVFTMAKQERRKLMHHGVYQGASGDATGGIASIYSGAFDTAKDYSALQAVKETTVALGTVSETLPAIDGPHTVVVEAYIDVPETGTYSLHAGYKSSAYNVVTLDGTEVYRKDVGKQPIAATVQLEAGKRYPITITYAKGGSAAFWMERTGLEGNGDLKTLTMRDKKFPWIIDEEGNWTTRNDVIYVDTRLNKEAGGRPLTPTVNGKGDLIGPEVQFGYVMGTYHDEPVLLIESSIGNRSINWDYRPPSSGPSGREGADKWEGLEYRLLIEGVDETLKNIDKIVPGYRGQGYEIVGFVWWQGHKDSGQTKAEYEGHLVNLIQDLRKDLKAPDMLATVATVGFHGWELPEQWQGVFEAQIAVGDPKQHPEFAGKVATVDTRGFWRSTEASPKGVDYHYNLNAETYMLTGDALGRAMVDMLDGKAEMLPGVEMPEPTPPKAEPTEAELAAHTDVLEPMIIDGMLRQSITSDSSQKKIKDALTRTCPEAFSRRWSQFLGDEVDNVISYYQEIGNRKHDWQDFGPSIRTGEWEYFSFDPPEEKDKSAGSRYREVSLPEGMENWMAPDFDAAAAGWESGNAPFGQLRGEKNPLSEGCGQNICGCSELPGTLWEHEVLLMRTTVQMPKLEKDHRYRIVVGGSAHVNAGEGFAIYANGKLLGETSQGVQKRQGAKPRGAHVYVDVRDEFDGGPVALAVKSFLRYNHPRSKEVYPRGHITVWLQEQKIPDILLEMVEDTTPAEEVTEK